MKSPLDRIKSYAEEVDDDDLYDIQQFGEYILFVMSDVTGNQEGLMSKIQELVADTDTNELSESEDLGQWVLDLLEEAE